jgi:hypothetical protein
MSVDVAQEIANSRADRLQRQLVRPLFHAM